MLITSIQTDLIQLFQQGGIIAYPTEAIYGLGCDPENEAAVLRLLHIKKRPIKKGLILVAADFSQVKKYLQPLTKDQHKLTLPSAITYTFPALDTAPYWLTGDFGTLAVRITQHALTQQLCRAVDSPLVSTSANYSGESPAKTWMEVANIFVHDDSSSDSNSTIDAIIKGATGGATQPSIIRDAVSGKIIRS